MARQRFDHERLEVYRRAVDVYADCTSLAAAVPTLHRSMAWQLLRAAGSVPLNIAEGTAEVHPLERARFYRIALRSVAETGAAIEILRRVDVVPAAAAAETRGNLLSLSAMLTALIGATRKKPRLDSR